MIDPSWTAATISKFRGAQSYTDEGPIEQALEAINCEFRENGDTVRTRLGFGECLSNVTETSAGCINWVSELGNYLVWLKPGTGVRIGAITGNPFTPSTIIADASAAYAQFLVNGNRLYVVLLDSNQRSTTSGYVISRVGGTFYADKLFAPPKTNLTSVITEPNAGRITAGVHYLGVILEHRGGFIGRPSPDSGSGSFPDTTTFSWVTFTASGSKTANWSITPATAWPDSAVRAHLVMTPVSNRALLIFVPDAVVSVPAGTTSAIAFTWNISDDELRQSARDDSNLLASKSLLYDTQSVAGTAQYTPYGIFSYGDRVGYLTQIQEPDGNKVCSLLISERGNAERVMLTRSLVRLPGQLPITLAFDLSEQVCILGPDYTFITSDTGGDPVQWSIPTQISKNIGTPAIRGVDVNGTDRYAIVASKAGLFPFNGFSYPILPISYGQTDKWDTINWNYAGHVVVRNDVTNRIIYVIVPVNNPVEYKLWCWSYKNFDPKDMGRWWKQVDFTEVSISGFTPRDMVMVRNQLPAAIAAAYDRQELWLFPGSAGSLRRKKTSSDTYPYADGPNGSRTRIATTYTPRWVPEDMGGAQHMHHGCMLRVSGSGRLQITVTGVNGNETGDVRPPITQANDPVTMHAQARDYECAGFDMIASQAKYTFENLDADSYFIMSNLRLYHSLYSLY